MMITVFGASGRTGSKVVECAMKSGHSVVAVSRKAGSIEPHGGLKILAGDVDFVTKAVEASDAVICCIGPRNNFRAGTLVSDGVQNIVVSCKEAGCRRMVFQSGITMTDGRELSIINRWVVRFFRRVYSRAGDDKAIAERIVMASGLDWVIVRPAGMKDSPARHSYTAEPRARVAPLRLFSYEDCADCLVRAATNADWVGEIVNVGR